MNNTTNTARFFPSAFSAAAMLFAISGHAIALQPDSPPAAAQPAATPPANAEAKPTAVEGSLVGIGLGRPKATTGRRVIEGPPAPLAFKNVSVEELISFIVKATGKVVMPQSDILNKRITVLNEQPIPREEALDLIFLALFQSGIAIVETDTTITMHDRGEMVKQDIPVIGPNESSLDRKDLGVAIEKVFALRNNNAKNLGEVLKDTIPNYSKLTVDNESNQIAVLGSVAFVQRMERLINSLDRPASGALQTETFRLRYADAEAVKTNIDDLFGANSANNRNRNNQNNQDQAQRAFRFGGGGGGGGGGGEAATTTNTEIRVTASVQQNAVTVVADPAILAQIRSQIEHEWDKPLPDEAVVPRIFDLKYTDPVKVSALLDNLFRSGTRTTGGQNNNNQQQQGGSTQGVGRLAGQFSFQPISEAGRLVVIAKSPDNMEAIAKIIDGIDQPQTVGLPSVVELKHASAEDLAEQLNALLSQDGTLASIRRAESGLSDDTANASPFASDQAATTNTNNADTNPADITFWWQRSRTPTDRRTASNLIGQLRIVPVWRQNALMVVAPPEYKQSILDLIEKLDRPGRQVLISAIVAEVSKEDATELGLRWGSGALSSTNGDNSIGVGTKLGGTENNFANSLFDTSVLTVNTDVNAMLSALNEKTEVSILSEPKIFTSDNQEAEFFDGQDIPFVTDSQTTDQGNLNQSFDYRAVGIQLRARPRITINGAVDLRVNVELSSIVPGQTLFGGFIVDRRETTTQLILQDKQTVVISGILREQSSEIVRKVPLLGDIPLLGEAFKSRDIQKRNTELLVFITPIVVTNAEAMEPVNRPYRERLTELQNDLSKGMNKNLSVLKQVEDLKAAEAAKGVAPMGTTPPTPATPEPTNPAPNNP